LKSAISPGLENGRREIFFELFAARISAFPKKIARDEVAN